MWTKSLSINAADLLPCNKPLQILTFISGIISALWGRLSPFKSRQISRLAVLTARTLDTIVSDETWCSFWLSFRSCSDLALSDRREASIFRPFSVSQSSLQGRHWHSNPSWAWRSNRGERK